MLYRAHKLLSRTLWIKPSRRARTRTNQRDAPSANPPLAKLSQATSAFQAADRRVGIVVAENSLKIGAFLRHGRGSRLAEPDAVSLAHAQRRIPTPRPLTHELMSEVLQRFDIDLVAVRIVGRVGAVHFAELDLRGRSGRSVHSCRPTDALILALHQPVQVPILVDARLLEGTGDVPPPGAG